MSHSFVSATLLDATNATPGLAQTPDAPYYAVIFTSQRTSEESGYGATAERMVEAAAQQPGFLGIESCRGADGLGITVSYWRSLEDIKAWRLDQEHKTARDQGRASWYAHFAVRIARVERAYDWQKAEGVADPTARTDL